MRALVSHPVPVRWRPPRASADRVAFQVARTEVEIPEIEGGGLADRREYVLERDEPVRTYFVHAGRAWHRVTRACLGSQEPDRYTPAPAATFAEALAAPPQVPRTPFRRLTPLFAGGGDGTPGHAAGEDLPETVLARASADNTAAARAALRAFARDNFLVDARDGTVFAARGMPAILPLANHALVHHAPARLDRGPAFEPARFVRMGRFSEEARNRGKGFERVLSVHQRFAGEPQSGHDLDLYLHDGPATFERLYATARERCRARNLGLDTVEPHLAPLRPYADLGRIGATPEGERAAVADLMLRALDALRAAIPEDYDPPQLTWLLAYHRHVVRFAFPPPELPRDDLDSLGGLAPGP